MTFTVTLTADQLDTLRSEMSILMPDMQIEYEAGQLRIQADDPATAERLAMDALCDILEPIRDLPTWSELSRQQAKRLRQSGVRVTSTLT